MPKVRSELPELHVAAHRIHIVGDVDAGEIKDDDELHWAAIFRLGSFSSATAFQASPTTTSVAYGWTLES